MIGILTAFHVLIALILILAVLLQSSKGADLAGAFGGMGSQTAFGPRGTATFLSKATVVLAILFMVTSITLGILGTRVRGGGGSSVLGDEPAAATEPGAPESTTPSLPGAVPVPDVTVTPPEPAAAPEGQPAPETPAPPPPAEPAGQ